jgi:hypothetical protein
MYGDIGGDTSFASQMWMFDDWWFTGGWSTAGWKVEACDGVSRDLLEASADRVECPIGLDDPDLMTILLGVIGSSPPRIFELNSMCFGGTRIGDGAC